MRHVLPMIDDDGKGIRAICLRTNGRHPPSSCPSREVEGERERAKIYISPTPTPRLVVPLRRCSLLPLRAPARGRSLRRRWGSTTPSQHALHRRGLAPTIGRHATQRATGSAAPRRRLGRARAVRSSAPRARRCGAREGTSVSGPVEEVAPVRRGRPDGAVRPVRRPGRVCVACEAARRAHPVAVGRVRRRVGPSSRKRNHRARRNRGCDRRGWGQQWRVVRRRRIRSRLATRGEGCGTKVWRRNAEITSAAAAAVRMRTVHGIPKARIAHAGRFGFDFGLVIPACGTCAAAIKVTKGATRALTMATVTHMTVVAWLGVGLVGFER